MSSWAARTNCATAPLVPGLSPIPSLSRSSSDLLAWHVVRDRACAAMAGLLAILSGPVMLHAHAHLELIYVGSFPVFLLAWSSEEQFTAMTRPPFKRKTN